MADKIQIRRDTAANWTSANPTLAQGEFGWELDTAKIKVGDGTTAWNSLAYRFEGVSDHTLLSNIGTNSHADIDNHIADSAIHTDWSQPGAGTIDPSNYVDNDTVYSHPNHTGDVTSVGDGVQTIANNAVTNAKAADMPANTIKGNDTGGTTDPQDLTAAEVRALINVADGANNYVHPNHSGEVTSVGDGAQTVQSSAITNKPSVTPQGTDQVLIADNSDSNNLKRVTIQSIADLVELDIDSLTQITDVDVANDWLVVHDATDGQNKKVNLNSLRDELKGIVPYHCLATGNIGSASNAANQNFQLDLSSCNFQIGDTVRIGVAHIRGDFSSDGDEYIDVGIGSTGDPKARLGEIGYDDLAIFRTDGSMIDRTYTVVDIGGGVPGLQVYVSPAFQVNFSPSGMPNGWWWQLKLDVLVV